MKFWQKIKNKITSTPKPVYMVFLSLLYLFIPKTTYAIFFLPLAWAGFAALGGSIAYFGSKGVQAVVGAAATSALDGATMVTGNVVVALSSLLLVITRGLYNIAAWVFEGIINLSLSNQLMDTGVITQIWSLVRDFSNIGLIFIILYISITTILGLNGPNTTKLIGKLIVVGVLINFSLLFTNLLIDSTNIVSLQFANAIQKDSSMGSKITEALGINNITSQVPSLSANYKTAWANAATTIGLIVFLFAAAFVMFVGAAIFIVRIISLIFVAIFSPLAFVMSILPATEKYAKEWWGKLIGNALVAPAYLFMVYISFNFIAVAVPPVEIPKTQVVDMVMGFEKVTEETGPSIVKILTNFVIALGLLTASAAAAAEMEKETTKAGGALASYALGTGAGLAAATSRQTIGRMGQYVSEKIQSGEGVRIPGTTLSFKNESLQKVGSYLGKSSFDVRAAQINEDIPYLGALAGGAKLANMPGLGALGESVGVKSIGPAGGAGGIVQQEADRAGRLKKEADAAEAEARRLQTGVIIQKLGDASTAGTDIEIQAALKRLRADEQLSLVGKDMNDPGKQHLIRNLGDGRVLKDLKDKLDATGQAELKRLVTSNAGNAGGKKFYEEELKQDAEKATVVAMEKFLGDIATAQPAEIRNQFAKPEVKPSVVVKIMPKIMSLPDAQRSSVLGQLQGRHINTLFDTYTRGDNNDISGDTILKVKTAVEANAGNVAGNKLFRSKRFQEQLPS